MEKVEKVELRGFPGFPSKTWKTWKTPFSRFPEGLTRSARARRRAEKEIPLRGIVFSPVSGFSRFLTANIERRYSPDGGAVPRLLVTE